MQGTYAHHTQHNICHVLDLQAPGLHSLREEHDSAPQHNPLNSTGEKTDDKYTLATEIPYGRRNLVGCNYVY